MRDDDTDIEALPASVSFRFVSYGGRPAGVSDLLLAVNYGA